MALLTTISSANEVLISYKPPFYEKSTSGSIAKERLRAQKSVEYRGLTEAAAVAAANAISTDIAGTIMSDGTATSPTLHVDGFTSATGTIWTGTSVKIEGDDCTYYVSETATIAANEVDLVLTENYQEPGTILVNGGGQAGTSIIIDGFTNASGFVRKGTLLEIAGDATNYTVTAQVAIIANGATVAITPTLAATPADDAAVTITHPPANDTPIALDVGGISATVQRANESGAYTLGLNSDYFPSGNLWGDA